MVWIQVRNGITRPGRGPRPLTWPQRSRVEALTLILFSTTSLLKATAWQPSRWSEVVITERGNAARWECRMLLESWLHSQNFENMTMFIVTFSLFITSKLCILWLFCGTQHSKSARRIDASSFLSLEIILEVWRWARYHLYILLKIKSGTSLAVLYCNKDYRSHASINVSLLILSLFRNCVVTGSLRFTIRITFANSLWTHRSVSGKK